MRNRYSADIVPSIRRFRLFFPDASIFGREPRVGPEAVEPDSLNQGVEPRIVPHAEHRAAEERPGIAAAAVDALLFAESGRAANESGLEIVALGKREERVPHAERGH